MFNSIGDKTSIRAEDKTITFDDYAGDAYNSSKPHPCKLIISCDNGKKIRETIRENFKKHIDGFKASVASATELLNNSKNNIFNSIENLTLQSNNIDNFCKGIQTAKDKYNADKRQSIMFDSAPLQCQVEVTVNSESKRTAGQIVGVNIANKKIIYNYTVQVPKGNKLTNMFKKKDATQAPEMEEKKFTKIEIDLKYLCIADLDNPSGPACNLTDLPAHTGGGKILKSRQNRINLEDEQTSPLDYCE